MAQAKGKLSRTSARRKPPAKSIDPVFAAIEAHRKAELAFSARIHAEGDDHPPATDVAEKKASRALRAFMATRPTTIEGALAALEYVSSPMPSVGPTRTYAHTVLHEAFVSHRHPVYEACMLFPGEIAAVLRKLTREAA